MAYRAVGVSDVGSVRKVNEDAFLCLDHLCFFAVADGMGGHNAGEVASQLAIDAVGRFIERSADGAECSWPYGLEPTLSYEANRVRTAIHLGNRRVFRAAEERDEYTGMGTTIVCALISGSKLVVGHVGDSRLYVWSRGELQQITRDDSWAMTILDREDAKSPDAVARHPMRHVLTNVLGARDHTDIHVVERALEGPELILLCSDGLHGALEDRRVAEIMAIDSDLAGRAQALVDAAIAAGSRDNVTAVLIGSEEPLA